MITLEIKCPLVTIFSKEYLIKLIVNSKQQHLKTNILLIFVKKVSSFQPMMLIWQILMSKSKVLTQFFSCFRSGFFIKVGNSTSLVSISKVSLIAGI